MEQHVQDEQGLRYDKRFGKNTLGTGIALLVLVLSLAVLAAWWLWNKGDSEADHYRFGMEQVGTRGTGSSGGPATPQTINPLQLGKLDSLGNFMYETGDMVNIELADGTSMRVGSRSTEKKLYDFLFDANNVVDTVDKTKGWISLDRVFFATGSSTLTETSQAQVNNLAGILKQFPGATIKLGGYTDNTGDSSANLRISQSRANAVMAALKTAGVANGLEAEGYGPQHPLADNATAEGKAMNRRVDVRVTKK